MKASRVARAAQPHRPHSGSIALPIWRLALAGLMLSALIGCATYQSAPFDPKRTADQFSARRLEDRQLQEQLVRIVPRAGGSWPLQSWDRGELLAVALLQNPELALARAEVAAAFAREITAAQLVNPDLTLQSEYAAHQEMHPWLYGLSLDWLLRSPQRRRLERGIAHSDTANMRNRLMDQTWVIRHALNTALSDWEGARRRLALLDRLAVAQDRLLTLERDRIRAGEDSPGGTVTAEQTRIDVEQQQAQLKASENVAQAAAAKALGLPPDALDAMLFIWPEWGTPPPVSDQERGAAREQALLSRADLAVAIGEYDIAEARLKSAVAKQYPQLTLNPGYYWDHGIAKFPFDVGFTLPVNGNKGEIAEARAAREIAGKHLLALQADIYGEIIAAERAENLARAGAETAERRLETARRQLQQSDLGVRLGETDVLERVGAEILSIRAELEVVEMQERLQAARNDLEDVLHTPLSGPEIALARSTYGLAPGVGS